MEKEIKSYNSYHRKGITDLQCIYAFIGSSQGDNSATNDVQEYEQSEGWLSFIFDKSIDKFDQDAINKESKRREDQNKDIIQKLKDTGEYGKEYSNTIHLTSCPLFDENKEVKELPLESHKMYFIDMSSDGRKIQ